MKFILTLLVTLFTGSAFGQKIDSSKIKKGTFDNYTHLRTKQNELGIDRLTYLDSTFNYQVKIPNWLTIKETGSINIWGGILPPIEGIENAIIIKSFKKSNYKSLKDFKNYLVEGLEFGHPVRWNQSYLFMGKKPLDDYKNIGISYKIYLIRAGLMYDCEYILLETRTSYLWIDFTSTRITFDKNINKFEEFMSGFQITDFK